MTTISSRELIVEFGKLDIGLINFSDICHVYLNFDYRNASAAIKIEKYLNHQSSELPPLSLYPTQPPKYIPPNVIIINHNETPKIHSIMILRCPNVFQR